MLDTLESRVHVVFVLKVLNTMRQYLTVYLIVDSIKFTIMSQGSVNVTKEMDSTELMDLVKLVQTDLFITNQLRNVK